MGHLGNVLGKGISVNATLDLLPAENINLTMVKNMLERGENPGPNVTGFLVLTIERLAGIADWTSIPQEEEDE